MAFVCVSVCGYSEWIVLFCLVHCYSSFLPSCMALSFTEIVNQLNALSCLHGDDDDDGVLKRARKATAKPAATSQGLFSPFFLLSHPVFLTLLLSSCEHCVSFALLFITTFYFHIFIFLNLFFPAFLSLCFSLSLTQPPHPPSLLYIGIVIVLWSYNLSWSVWWCAVQGIVNTSVGVHPFGSYSLFFDSVASPILFLQLVVNQNR